MSIDIAPFLHQYADLPTGCYSFVAPRPASRPRLVRVNHDLAHTLGIDIGTLTGNAGVSVLSGNATAAGSRPLAMAYAGHQFGGWVPSLGDGRAILLGEIRGQDGLVYDIQLKGSGRTPYSRNGDGLAAIGPVLREYIVSEAMHALGVPTTRSLAALTTGDPVFRERTLPGAILVRVARSHIRVGTFQYFLARDQINEIRAIADLQISRKYIGLTGRKGPYHKHLEADIA
ncbi:MAG: protein adenylyltransferase SelO family protein, partial [Rhodobacteraceae bacterium]|nr:protein adenylyltransferase SelO family protein [Paracoccaceae bacterium]